MQKIGLHSWAGYLFVGILHCVMLVKLASPFVGFFLGLRSSPSVQAGMAIQSFGTGILLAVFLWWYTWRVYVTEKGIVLGSSSAVVPWEEVAGFRDLGGIGGNLVHLHQLKFRGGRRSLVFFAHWSAVDDFNRMRARHQTTEVPAQHGSVK